MRQLGLWVFGFFYRQDMKEQKGTNTAKARRGKQFAAKNQGSEKTKEKL